MLMLRIHNSRPQQEGQHEKLGFADWYIVHIAGQWLGLEDASPGQIL